MIRRLLNRMAARRLSQEGHKQHRAKVIAKAIELAEQNGRPDLVQRLRGV